MRWPIPSMSILTTTGSSFLSLSLSLSLSPTDLSALLLIFRFFFGLICGFVFLVRLIRLLLVFRFLLVAFGRERRLVVLAKNGQVDAARDAVFVAGHVETGGCEGDVSRCREIEILAVLVEDRVRARRSCRR